MDGLYKTAFSNEGMSPKATNRHWKREQDDYLIKLGAMDKIKRDPTASLGYAVRRDPEMMTLRMGSNTPEGLMGVYTTYEGKSEANSFKPDGELDVSVDMKPSDYGETIAHELGHVGSRNILSDKEFSKNARSGEEEKRQRLVDYMIHPLGSQIRRDAIWVLRKEYGIMDIEAEIAAMQGKADLEPPPKKKKKKKVATAPSQ